MRPQDLLAAIRTSTPQPAAVIPAKPAPAPAPKKPMIGPLEYHPAVGLHMKVR